jgi:transposase
MAPLGREEGWRPGRRRISGKRLRSIEMLKSQGMSNRAIAHRLGVTEKAIRKLVGPSNSAESAQLPLPAITTEAEKLVVYRLPRRAAKMEIARWNRRWRRSPRLRL